MLDDNEELNLFDKNDLVDVNHDKQVNSLGGGISSSEDELNVINNDEQPSYESVNVSHYLPFLKQHPQYKTHHVCCIEDNDRIVPNFIGGSLPHQDQGDCEYYCSTMLFTVYFTQLCTFLSDFEWCAPPKMTQKCAKLIEKDSNL
ncbi:hypothetical protein JOM56_012863 [Amanita muscaria]